MEVLLQATATALRTGCEAFKGGVLRTSISGPKQLLVALEGLSRDGRLEAEERRVFARAKEEVGRLWALQRQGGSGRNAVEEEALYAAYWVWWRPVLGVLERDREKRAGGGEHVGGKRESGRSSFAAALASGECPVRGEDGSVNGRSVRGSVRSKASSSGTRSLGTSLRRKIKDVFK